jgi:release factor glutamine methyltransferase
LLIFSAKTPGELVEMVDRRVAGLPLEVIVGWAEFCGLRIAIDPGVFVPRRRTEFLVRQAVKVARPGSVVVDLCCGSGALGLAVYAAVGQIALHSTDIDPAAVRCARRNVRGVVYEGDLYDPLPTSLRGQVDVLIANAPYVPSEAIKSMPAEAREHESRMALDGGPDGLDVQRKVASQAVEWLAPDGVLLMETSKCQASRTAQLLATAGLVPRVVGCAELDATVAIAEPVSWQGM